MEQLWVLKSKGDKSSFGGNAGYADSPTSHYVFDTTVKNHNKIKSGDFIVIVDKVNIIGYAKITSIQVKKDVPKIRYRCPVCNIQEHAFRKNMQPKYKCRKKHEFDVPVEQNIVVDEYIANYESTFLKALPNTSVKTLEGFYIKRNFYYSIQAADVSFIKDKFQKHQIALDDILNEPDLTYTMENVTPYSPSSNDERKIKARAASERPGQDKFRNELMRIYGSYCMITGVNVSAAIEASHICPYRGEKDNHIQNGLLLRSDLHKLFDCNLLGINPESLTIELHPSIKATAYNKYEGVQIKSTRSDCQPSRNALEIRWNLFKDQLRN